MDENQDQPEQLPLNLEAEIREGRKFTLAEAIGRLGGPGMLKGVSPTTRKQQAEAVIEHVLEHHLISPAGALNAVLLRQVTESELLLSHLDQPLQALLDHLKRILDSEYLLQELVRESDCEWGRIYGERPYFERPGKTPHEDDPYTIASVKTSLMQLLERLAAAKGPDN